MNLLLIKLFEWSSQQDIRLLAFNCKKVGSDVIFVRFVMFAVAWSFISLSHPFSLLWYSSFYLLFIYIQASMDVDGSSECSFFFNILTIFCYIFVSNKIYHFIISLIRIAFLLSYSKILFHCFFSFNWIDFNLMKKPTKCVKTEN